MVSLIEKMNDPKAVREVIEAAETDFVRQNTQREREFRELIPDAALETLRGIREGSPLIVAVTDAADNWVAENLKDAGRLPNDNEWNRLKSGPLDGRIGMSFALQWRYNFGRLFAE